MQPGRSMPPSAFAACKGSASRCSSRCLAPAELTRPRTAPLPLATPPPTPNHRCDNLLTGPPREGRGRPILASNRDPSPCEPMLQPNISEAGADEDMPAVPLGRDFPEIRDAVAAICKKYPGAYWRDLEDRREYPHEFVKELGDAGYLAALIPQEFGGAGLPLRAGSVILEEIHASGCMASHCHAQMYMMEMLLRHGNAEQKTRYLLEIAANRLRFQSF